MDLAAELSDPSWGATTSAWGGYEVAVGYGVMSLPLSSGHQLGLRVTPRTDFGGYVSVWHHDPAAGWTQYVAEAPVEAGCPRLWGPALERAAAAGIDVTWTGPMSLEVTVDRPRLIWSLELERTLPLMAVNAVNAVLPLGTWRPRPLVAAREWVGRLLGLGAIRMSGAAASGERLVAAFQRLYWIRAATARLDGRDLGRPVDLPHCPTIGDWPLPRRPVFAVGEAHATIADPRDYARLRRRTVGQSPDGG